MRADIFLRYQYDCHHSDFITRLRSFFYEITSKVQLFDVYMRVQAKHEILQIERIGRVAFYDRVPHLSNVIAEMRYRNNVTLEDEDKLRNYFFESSTSHTLIFAVVADIEAEDYSRAAVFALQQLDRAVQRAKFEFELDGFSIDNKLYVHSEEQNTLVFYTRRQALRSQNRSNERILRLERLIHVLDEIEANEGLSHELIEKITNYAMQWFRSGREALSCDSKLLNYWFGLEQLFKVVPGNIDGKDSSGDKCVLALARTLEYRHAKRIIGNIWRDLVHAGIFGPQPVVSSQAAEVIFNEALRRIVYRLPRHASYFAINKEHYYDIVSASESKPQIILRFDTGDHQTIPVSPGVALYLHEHERVSAGQLLMSALLRNDPHNDALAKLLEYGSPTVTNFWVFLVAALFQKADVVTFLNFSSLHTALHDLSRLEKSLVPSHDQPSILNAIEILYTIQSVFLGLLTSPNDTNFTQPKIAFNRVAVWIQMMEEIESLCYDIDKSNVRIVTKMREEIEKLRNGMDKSNVRIVTNWKDETTPEWLLIHFEELKARFRSTPQQSIYNRLNRLSEQYDILYHTLPIYKLLYQALRGFESQPLSLSVFCELFRGKKPSLDPDHRLDISVYHTAPHNDQELLARRLMNPLGPDVLPHTIQYYIWQLDRIRRARNALVHNASVSANLEITALRLQQYARVYLRLVIGRLARFGDVSPWHDRLEWVLGFEH